MVKVLGPNDKKISGLAAASALASADLVPVVQSGTTEKATMDQIRSFVGGALAFGSTGTQGAGFASDTYLSGTGITIADPTVMLKARTQFWCMFSVSKSGAGTVAPIITIRYGTLGTTSDAGVLAFTFPAQTAVVDEGVFEIFAHFRSVGSGTAAVMAGVARLTHDKGSAGTSAGTGLSVESTPAVIIIGSGFNSTPANSIIGVSVNGGTSAAWTVAVCQCRLSNLF